MIKVGQKLYEERMRQGLSLEEVSKATKIRMSFLLALEKGDYNVLPSRAYIQGFVKNYASYLGIPQKEIMPLFRREFNERDYNPVLPEGFARKEHINIRRVRLGAGIFSALVLLGIIIVYIVFQYRYAFINPPLSIDSPTEGGAYTTSVIVAGNTDPNASLYVQDTLVPVDKNGDFKKTISAFPGAETVIIKSQNRFGRQTEIQRHIVVHE